MPTLKTPKTKAEADAVCEALGAHVLAIETAKENELVNKLVYQSCEYLANTTSTVRKTLYGNSLYNVVKI